MRKIFFRNSVDNPKQKLMEEWGGATNSNEILKRAGWWFQLYCVIYWNAIATYRFVLQLFLIMFQRKHVEKVLSEKKSKQNSFMFITNLTACKICKMMNIFAWINLFSRNILQSFTFSTICVWDKFVHYAYWYMHIWMHMCAFMHKQSSHMVINW